MSSVASLTVDPLADAPGTAAGLRDTAAVCSVEQVALAARMLIAAHVIEVLHALAIAQMEACIAAEDLLVRCDAESRPNDLPEATDDEWDAVLAQLRGVIGKAEKS